jgi:hypothetical protein
MKDHVATVCAYLNDYRCETDIGERSKLSDLFSAYLLSLCWQKMHARVMSWPVIGLIWNMRILLDSDAPVLEKRGDDYAWSTHVPGPGDRSLAEFLASNIFDRLVQDVADATHGTIHTLLTAVRMVPEDKPEMQFTVGFYTKETFMDFHRLLVGCLMRYATTLRRLKRLTNQRKNKMGSTRTTLCVKPADPQTLEAKIVSCFMLLDAYNRLLLLILSSHAYATHLQILTLTQQLLPDHKYIAMYERFKKNSLSFDLPGAEEFMVEDQNEVGKT